MRIFESAAAIMGTLSLAFNLNATQVISDSQPDWAHTHSDIQVDQRILYGQLPNGLRYAIMKNSEPQKRVYLRMCVASGSFNELENQRGLAHFLEHMVFNGSKNFPQGVNEHFQHLGLEFGRDVNAYTSFESTVYRIDPPENTPEHIADSLLLFRDYADGALLRDKDIDDERGVILSEKRDSEDARRRSIIELYKFLYPGTVIADRFPIGTVEVIAKAPAQRIRDYYYDYYSADRIMIAIAGDIDPVEVEAMIKKQFSDLHSSSKPNKNLGNLIPTKELKVKQFTEPEIRTTYVHFTNCIINENKAENIQTRSEDLCIKFVQSLFNLRLDRMSKDPNSTFNSAGIIDNQVANIKSYVASILPKEGKTFEAIQTMEQEIRRAREFGFTNEEIDTVRKNMLAGYLKSVQQAPSRTSSQLADYIYACYQKQKVASTPETNLQLAELVLTQIDKTICQAYFSKMFPNDQIGIFIENNQAIENVENTIRNVYNESKKVAVTAPKEIEQKPFAYQNFGPEGKIAMNHHVEDLDITQVRFENNVILNLKKTDYQKGKVILYIGVGDGLASLPRDKQGLNQLAEAIYLPGGLQQHNADEVERLMAGKTIGISFKAEAAAFNFGGTTTPYDLKQYLQLATAYVIEPGFRPEALAQFQNFLDMIYKQNEQTPMGFYKNEFTHYIAGNDPRFGFPPIEKMRAYTEQDLKDWLLPQLKNGAIEIGIVGDIDVQETIKLVAQTFGALPKRQEKKALDPKVLTLNTPWNDGEKIFTYNSQEPRGIVCTYWPSNLDGQYDVRKARRISMLGDILSEYTNKIIREKEGAAYSPAAFGFISRDYHHFGYMMCLAQVDADKSEFVLDLMEEIGTTLAEKGFTKDEFLRIQKPRIFAIRDQLKDNSYWLNSVVSRSQSNPEVLDWCRTIKEDMSNITYEELSQLAKEIFSKKPLRVTLIPEK